MATFLIAYVSLALLLGGFAYILLPMVGRGRRALIASSFAVLLGGLFLGYSDMLGRPKSTQMELLRGNSEDARILGAYFKENDGVFLWLQLPGVAEPRYYKLPWDEKVAQQIQSAIEQNAQEHGGGVAMKLPFERSWAKKEEPKFYPLPQPKLPDKPYERNDPSKTLLYQAPEQGV
jgi:hypothetical protein